MSETHQYVRVDFRRFKAFEKFTLWLRHFNILVGPNNAGKSTVLAAFRILAAALRKADSRKSALVPGPRGDVLGYVIDLGGVSVAEENIFFNYDESEPASVSFTLSNKNILHLYFPERGACYLSAETDGNPPKTPKLFREQFNCQIGFVPILGPVDHHEGLYEKEAARRALFNYTAARNFRNIWYHYPEKFKEFQTILAQTWPGMAIDHPKVDVSHGKALLHMFCPEDRIPREIFWAGFGFQVWCQMLTHLVQSSDKVLFLIDEPDIYLHADLQRQLLGLLRNLGPDILIATHSAEIITEAEADDIVLINKKRKSARRIKSPSELSDVFAILGSNLNPILTQLAKTRRGVFVEGKDFQIIGRFARKLNFSNVGNRTEFAVVPVEGFSPERVRSLKTGMETTLGGKVATAAILDRDFRSEPECDAIEKSCNAFCDMARVLGCKEIENFLLVHEAIDRAARKKLADHNRRTGKSLVYGDCAEHLIEEFASKKKNYLMSQSLAARRKFEKETTPKIDEATTTEAALAEFENRWNDPNERVRMVPGKDALSYINSVLQSRYGITATPTAIIDAMTLAEIPVGIRTLVMDLGEFAKSRPGKKK